MAVTADQGAVQVDPAAGLQPATIAFSYTVSDGRGATASAQRRRRGRRATTPSNRPPVAMTDIAEVRGGASASFNVLNNDYDPDGDTFVLSDVRSPPSAG